MSRTIVLRTALMAALSFVAGSALAADLEGTWIFDKAASEAAITEQFGAEAAHHATTFMQNSRVVFDMERKAATYMLNQTITAGKCDISGTDGDGVILTGCKDAAGESADAIEFGLPTLKEDGTLVLTGSKGDFFHYTKSSEQ